MTTNNSTLAQNKQKLSRNAQETERTNDRCSCYLFLFHKSYKLADKDGEVQVYLKAISPSGIEDFITIWKSEGP